MSEDKINITVHFFKEQIKSMQKNIKGMQKAIKDNLAVIKAFKNEINRLESFKK